MTAASAPKLKAGDYGGLVQCLITLSKDTQVVVGQHAIKATGVLAKGLRKEFEKDAIICMSNFFPKFKDRKLYPAIQEALDNFMFCLDLQTIIE